MYTAIIDEFYTNGSAVFYHVAGKLDLAPILMHRLNQGETVEEAIARWNTEQHWLADWSGSTPVPGFRKSCRVVFDMKSSTFYHTVKHDRVIKQVRNINVTGISVSESEQSQPL